MLGLLCLLPLSARAHGTFTELMSVLEEQIKAAPEDAALYVRRAALQLEQRDWCAALVDLERASRKGAKDSDVSLLRGQALVIGKCWPQATLAFDEYLVAHSNSIVALTERARVDLKLGNVEAGIADYLAALRVAEKPEPSLVMEAARVLADHQRGEPALRLLDDAMAKTGKVPALVSMAVELELAARHLENALGRLDQMIAQPHPETWMARRASVLAQMGRTRESVAAWKRLRQRIAAMPELERRSHAMCKLDEQADMAIAALKSLATNEGGMEVR